MLNISYIPKSVLHVCTTLQQAGARAWLVGGSVRDLLLDVAPQDWDIEVYGLSPDALEAVLQSLGRCSFVGKHFAVYKLWREHIEMDVALPRTEIKTGAGHQAFAVTADPSIAPQQAVLRRDFTINAMMFDPLSQTLLDFHQGQDDLKGKQLRHVSPAFAEDPLRPLRAMQFAARFGLTLADETAALCLTLKSEYTTLPASRIWQEWKKWAAADTPSFGLQALRKMGWLDLYPELQALVGCPQDTYWHPEGDVWVHTCLVLDAAAKIKYQRGFAPKDQLLLLMSALCHDLGKPVTTYTNDKGKVCAPQHDMAGKAVAVSLLHRLVAPKYLVSAVVSLVQQHMAHFYEQVSEHAVAKLAYRLSPVSIEMWEALTEADASGRCPAPASRPALAWLKQAKMSGVELKKAVPIVSGSHLISWGLKPSSHLGAVLKAAYVAQLEGEITDEITGEIWVNKNNLAVVKD